MENNSIFKELLNQGQKEGWLLEKTKSILWSFFLEYNGVIQTHKVNVSTLSIFTEFLEILKFQNQNPFVFQPFHTRITEPYDYYRFANNFLRPLVNETHSSIAGKQHIEKIILHQKAGHNVILFSNHQTEADPQAISILLDHLYPHFAQDIIFIAGERVIKDPLAVPFSLGRNLLCVYSKKHIDHPPEHRAEKQHHNKKTMQLMCQLLAKGGKCIYVAPSGGRDRQNKQGNIEIHPFDPQSIELFYLMAKKAQTPTFFYPMTLATYDLIPPPETTELEIGEKRKAQRTTIHLSMGHVIDMENFPRYDTTNKETQRNSRAHYIWQSVNDNYQNILKERLS